MRPPFEGEPRGRAGPGTSAVVVLLIAGLVGTLVYRVFTAVPGRSRGEAASPRLEGCGLEPVGEGPAAAPTPGGRAEQIRAIAADVARIRDLEFEDPVEPRFLSGAEVDARVVAELEETYTPENAETEGRILRTLGAIPAGGDLRELRAEALTGQVAGFYDPDTGELVVRAEGRDAELTPATKVTLAHELLHALADQHLDLPLDERPAPGAEDRALAGLAVIEGDATLVMLRYLATLPGSEQLQVLADPDLLRAEAQAAEMPAYLERELIFPYEAGLEYVCARYADGGWDAVNREYRRPPATTAQVLFPDRDAPDRARPPRARGRLPEPWSLRETVSLGAAPLTWLFAAPGGDRDRALDRVRERARAWAAGAIDLWVDGERSAVVISLVQRRGAPDLCDSMEAWYRAAFPDAERAEAMPGERAAFDGERQDALLSCPDDGVRLAIAPTLDLVRVVATRA